MSRPLSASLPTQFRLLFCTHSHTRRFSLSRLLGGCTYSAIAAGALGDPLLRPRAASVMACPLIIHSSHLSCARGPASRRAAPRGHFFHSSSSRARLPRWCQRPIVRVIFANFWHYRRGITRAQGSRALVWPTYNNFTFFAWLVELRQMWREYRMRKPEVEYFLVKLWSLTNILLSFALMMRHIFVLFEWQI